MILNSWINELKKFTWIRKVEIIAYNNADNMANFELLILY
jgi:hypothetical protein